MHCEAEAAMPPRSGPLRNGNPRFDLRLARRCGARTRSGCPCRSPAMRNGRCRMHGGPSTGPRTPEGRARVAAAHTRHGGYSVESRAFRARVSAFLARGRTVLAAVRAKRTTDLAALEKLLHPSDARSVRLNPIHRERGRRGAASAAGGMAIARSIKDTPASAASAATRRQSGEAPAGRDTQETPVQPINPIQRETVPATSSRDKPADEFSAISVVAAAVRAHVMGDAKRPSVLHYAQPEKWPTRFALRATTSAAAYGAFDLPERRVKATMAPDRRHPPVGRKP